MHGDALDALVVLRIDARDTTSSSNFINHIAFQLKKIIKIHYCRMPGCLSAWRRMRHLLPLSAQCITEIVIRLARFVGMRGWRMPTCCSCRTLCASRSLVFSSATCVE